jgi:hypothetical protein
MTQLRELLAHEDETRHFSFTTNIQDIIQYDPQLGYMLIYHPVLLLPIFEEAILRAQIKTIDAACNASYKRVSKHQGSAQSLPYRSKMVERRTACFHALTL